MKDISKSNPDIQLVIEVGEKVACIDAGQLIFPLIAYHHSVNWREFFKKVFPKSEFHRDGFALYYEAYPLPKIREKLKSAGINYKEIPLK